MNAQLNEILADLLFIAGVIVFTVIAVVLLAREIAARDEEDEE